MKTQKQETARQLRDKIRGLHKTRGICFNSVMIERITGKRKTLSDCTKAELILLLSKWEELMASAPKTNKWNRTPIEIHQTGMITPMIEASTANGKLHSAHFGCADEAECYKLLNYFASNGMGRWYSIKNPSTYRITDGKWELKVWEDEAGSIWAYIQKQTQHTFRVLRHGNAAQYQALAQEHFERGMVSPAYPKVKPYLAAWKKMEHQANLARI